MPDSDPNPRRDLPSLTSSPTSDPTSGSAPASGSASASALPVPVREGEVLRPASDNWLMRAIRTLFGWKAGSVRDDIQVALDASATDETSFSAVERTMLRNLLALHDQRIADVMIHRADIVAVKQDISLGELMVQFEAAAHSRFVVYNETLDDPVGMVHIRDLLAFMTSTAKVVDPGKTRRKKPYPAGLDLRLVDLSRPLVDTGLIRNLLYVPPSMRAIDLLAQMQASRLHLALVVDEYGGTDGLVSIEDIVEQIVGEIDDEHDEAEDGASLIAVQADGQYVVDALTPIADFNERFGADFLDDEYDTIGGLVTAAIGHLPETGEELTLGRFAFRVAKADARRVHAFHVGILADA